MAEINDGDKTKSGKPKYKVNLHYKAYLALRAEAMLQNRDMMDVASEFILHCSRPKSLEIADTILDEMRKREEEEKSGKDFSQSMIASSFGVSIPEPHIEEMPKMQIPTSWKPTASKPPADKRSRGVKIWKNPEIANVVDSLFEESMNMQGKANMTEIGERAGSMLGIGPIDRNYVAAYIKERYGYANPRKVAVKVKP